MADPRPDLDGLLDAWADRARLDRAEVDHIRRVVLAEPRALPATWWRDFGVRIGAGMAQAARTPAAVLVAHPATSRAWP